jgi:hypothetical protein
MMEAVAWSLFGLMAAALATLVTAYWRLADRIEDVRRDLGARIDAVNGRLDLHLDRHTS